MSWRENCSFQGPVDPGRSSYETAPLPPTTRLTSTLGTALPSTLILQTMSLLRLSRTLPRTTIISNATRAFSMSAIRAAEGDTGAPRSGGAAQGDAFTKREQASEDYYVRQQEKEKLEALKKKIADREAELAKDRQEIEELNKKQGGS